MGFAAWYRERSKKLNSVLCVGIDPTLEHLPLGWGSGRDWLENYLHFVVEEASTRVPVVKFNFAFFAALDMLDSLKDLINSARVRDLLVILDMKCSDIGESMKAYGRAAFDVFGADACTVSPYPGFTWFTEWIPWFEEGKAAICLVLTSNVEAEHLQKRRLYVSGQYVYESVAELVCQANLVLAKDKVIQNAIGAVVGATKPEQAPRCRELVGDNTFLLVPGYGAQGATADDAVAGLLNSRGEPMGCVNNSRGITMYSWKDKKTGKPKEGNARDLVVQAIDKANLDLNAALERKRAQLLLTERS